MSPLIAATPLALVAQWSTRSQEQATRNATGACAALAERRRERLEVEAFVADQLARRTPAAG
jgi:hypothetical protein